MITLLGYILAGYLGFRAAKIAYNLFYPFVIARILGLGVNVRKLGEWAVVTGSTDGIGKAYAIELAKRGLKIFLMARNPEKLKAVTNEIRKKFCAFIDNILAFRFEISTFYILWNIFEAQSTFENSENQAILQVF